MKIVEVHHSFYGGNLNLRQLLNPIFFSPVCCHPDSTRQRKARLIRARDLRQARELKAVPAGTTEYATIFVWNEKRGT
jgi:hypothetical protein